MKKGYTIYITKSKACERSLIKQFTSRSEDNHATPVNEFFKYTSNGKVPVCYLIIQHASLSVLKTA
jgi:hypothetical protein